jgi:VanZ family protein
MQPDPQTTPVRRRASLQVVIWYWLPAVLWMFVVLGASNDAFSAQHTGSILLAILQGIFGSIDPRTFDITHLVIRKSAHFIEYGILSALWFRAWNGLRSGGSRLYALLPALAMTLLVAVGDEWHQAFVPSRTSSPRDVVLDLCGAVFAQLVIWLVWRSRVRARELHAGSAAD